MLRASTESTRRMHTPTPQPEEDEPSPDVKQPPVPPDREPDVVPVEDPPKPGRERAPMIAAWLANRSTLRVLGIPAAARRGTDRGPRFR